MQRPTHRKQQRQLQLVPNKCLLGRQYTSSSPTSRKRRLMHLTGVQHCQQVSSPFLIPKEREREIAQLIMSTIYTEQNSGRNWSFSRYILNCLTIDQDRYMDIEVLSTTWCYCNSCYEGFFISDQFTDSSRIYMHI